MDVNLYAFNSGETSVFCETSLLVVTATTGNDASRRILLVLETASSWNWHFFPRISIFVSYGCYVIYAYAKVDPNCSQRRPHTVTLAFMSHMYCHCQRKEWLGKCLS